MSVVACINENRRASFFCLGAAASVMMFRRRLVQAAEQEDQQQDRERNAEQPEKSVSHHALPCVCTVICADNTGA
jgi:hypothetical protein